MDMSITPSLMVTVVGGGPVGMTCALALAARDVPVRVIERGERATTIQWRGSTLHPRSLELLDTIGLADRLVTDGVRVDRLQYRDPDIDLVAEFDYGLLAADTAFPFRLQYEQYKLLDALRAAVDEHPLVKVMYGHELRSVRDEGAAGFLLDLDVRGERVVMPAAFLIDAEGSHSRVRRNLQITFDGMTYPHRHLVIATDYPFEERFEDLGPVSYWTSSSGKLSFIRTPDHWRVGVTLLEDPGPGASAGQLGAIALGLLGRAFSWQFAIPLHQANASSLHQRIASSFRHGRAVLIGDAAHINSPTGGMGLNSGIHDAFALAETFQRILQGGEVDLEMQAFADARRAVALEVVQVASNENTAALEKREVSARRERLLRLRRLADDPDAARAYLRRASMLSPSSASKMSPR